MEEFIVSETSKIFTKGVKRYVDKYKAGIHDVSILLYLQRDEEVGYQIYVNGSHSEDVTIKDILGVKMMDLKGYSVIAPPYIQKFLLEFKNELKSDKVDISVYLDEDGEDVRFFLYDNGKLIREVFLKDLIRVKTEV
jgi:transcriptional regulator of heat shock response